MRTLAASSFAASVAVMATEPLWRANTVLRTIPRETAAGSSLLSLLVKLVREEGVAAQWNGVSVSLWLVCNPVIQFFVYEMIKRRVLRGGGGGAVGENLTAAQGFVIGAVSKAIAAITTYARCYFPLSNCDNRHRYPLSLAQTRLRLNKDARMLHVVCQIVREKGNHPPPLQLHASALDRVQGLWRFTAGTPPSSPRQFSRRPSCSAFTSVFACFSSPR